MEHGAVALWGAAAAFRLNTSANEGGFGAGGDDEESQTYDLSKVLIACDDW